MKQSIIDELEVLTDLIWERRTTQSEVAKEVGVDRAYLSRVINGHVIAGKALAVAIEKWAGGKVSAAKLMGV